MNLFKSIFFSFVSALLLCPSYNNAMEKSSLQQQSTNLTEEQENEWIKMAYKLFKNTKKKIKQITEYGNVEFCIEQEEAARKFIKILREKKLFVENRNQWQNKNKYYSRHCKVYFNYAHELKKITDKIKLQKINKKSC